MPLDPEKYKALSLNPNKYASMAKGATAPQITEPTVDTPYSGIISGDNPFMQFGGKSRYPGEQHQMSIVKGIPENIDKLRNVITDQASKVPVVGPELARWGSIVTEALRVPAEIANDPFAVGGMLANKLNPSKFKSLFKSAPKEPAKIPIVQKTHTPADYAMDNAYTKAKGGVVTPQLKELAKEIPPIKKEIPSISSESRIFLPKDLQGGKPRFNIGQKSWIPEFENDVDKALLIIAQKSPSKRNADYMNWLKKYTGLEELELTAAGTRVKDKLKNHLAGLKEQGQVKVPLLHDLTVTKPLSNRTLTLGNQGGSLAKPRVRLNKDGSYTELPPKTGKAALESADDINELNPEFNARIDAMKADTARMKANNALPPTPEQIAETNRWNMIQENLRKGDEVRAGKGLPDIEGEIVPQVTLGDTANDIEVPKIPFTEGHVGETARTLVRNVQRELKSVFTGDPTDITGMNELMLKDKDNIIKDHIIPGRIKELVRTLKEKANWGRKFFAGDTLPGQKEEMEATAKYLEKIAADMEANPTIDNLYRLRSKVNNMLDEGIESADDIAGDVTPRVFMPETGPDEIIGHSSGEMPQVHLADDVGGGNIPPPNQPMNPPNNGSGWRPTGVPASVQEDLLTNPETTFRELATKPEEWLGLARALKSSFDLSAPRQAMGLVGTKAFWKSTPQLIKSLGNDAYAASQAAITRMPHTELGIGDGLKLTDIHGHLGIREENFGNALADTIPIIRTIVKKSEQSYIGFLNTVRAHKYNDMVEKAVKAGMNPYQNRNLSKNFAEYVNNSTGRGDLGTWERNAHQLNTYLFAPRNMSATLRSFNYLNPKRFIKLDKVTRDEALTNWLSFAGLNVSILGLAKAGGAEVGWNPTKSNFGKVKIHNTTFDFTGGKGSYIAAAAQMADKGLDSILKKKRTSNRTGLDVAETFFENRAAPIPAVVLTMLKGTDFEGERADLIKETMKVFVPMFAESMYSVSKNDPELLPLAAISDLFGQAANSRKTKFKKGKGSLFPTIQLPSPPSVSLPGF